MMTTRPTTRPNNGGLAPRRWLRDREAERELLDLLDGVESPELPASGVPRESSPRGTPAPAGQVAGRAVFPMELTNR
jgi:hypothetical protein